MPTCPECGEWVSQDFARVLWVEEEGFMWCQNCRVKTGHQPEYDDLEEDGEGRMKWK